MNNQEEIDLSLLEELVSLSAERLGLNEPYVVEKDFYVTRAIQTLIELQNPHFKLIFQGGTALAKAHRIVQRMSEDCDFRIVPRDPLSFNKEQQRRHLRAFREQMIGALQQKGFHLEAAGLTVRNEGQLIQLSATYPSIFPAARSLKPHLALEFFFGALRTDNLVKTITTLVRQTLGPKVPHAEFEVEVMSLPETAAEKWVALTRRVASMTRNNAYEDASLVRHLYDLYKIQQSAPLPPAFGGLVKSIIQQDQLQFKSHNPVYYENPAVETQRALSVLKQDSQWQQHWNDFLSTMVFNNENLPYDLALNTIERLGKNL